MFPTRHGSRVGESSIHRSFAHRTVLVFLLVAILAGSLVPVGQGADEPVLARFVVMGDTGEGNAGQYAVAAAIGNVCTARGCDFVIIAGDLIYDAGVSSPNDPQFETKFELPYADLGLPFYLALGNHDNSDPTEDGLGTDSGRGDHQVAYTYRNDTSGKWRLPARYYHERIGDAVSLVGLDTNTMMSYGVTRKGLDPVSTALTLDPALLSQADYVDDALATSDAPWKIVFGHHPLYANGEHGNAGAYESEGQNVAGSSFPTTLGLGVKLFLEEHVCGKADLYLAGHDHDLEWLQPAPSCGATELIVSGAGSRSRELQDPTRNAVRFQQGGTTGFFYLELRATSFQVTAYDGAAQVLFEGSADKPIV